MLPDTISLMATKVDAVTGLNIAGENPTTYKRELTVGHRSVWHELGHVTEKRDEVSLTRRYGVRNGKFKGMEKVNLKFTRDMSVLDTEGNTITVPGIISVDIARPVGASKPAFIQYLRDVAQMLERPTAGDTLVDLSEEMYLKLGI